MVTDLMRYGLAVALLIVAAGLALERVAAWRGAPRRCVWFCALLLSLALPALRVMMSSPVAEPAEPVVLAPPPIAAPTTPAPDYAPPHAETPAVAATPSVEPKPAWLTVASLETCLRSSWIAASIGILTFYALLWLRLRIAARHWRRETMDSQAVWITEALGPAVFGFLRPRILMPQWTLEAPSASRSVMLAHEQEHIAAGDPWLLLLGLLLVAAAPWNLPLWWQLRRLRFAIEVDCDARVLRRGADPRAYGEVLLLVGQRRTFAPAGAIALTEPASQLRRRIRIMTERHLPRGRIVIGGLIGLSAACIAVAARLQAPTVVDRESSSTTYQASDREPVPEAAPATAGTSDQAAKIEETTNSRLFDLKKNASIQGVVIRRPILGETHNRTLWLHVPPSSGNRDGMWVGYFESVSPPKLRRQYQWAARSLNPRETVIIDFHPLRDVRRYRHGGLVTKITTADGRTIFGAPPTDLAAVNAPKYLTTAPQSLQVIFGTKTAWQAVVTAQPNPPSEDELDNRMPSQSRICFVDASTGVNDCTYFRALFRSPLYQAFEDLSVVPLTSLSPKTQALVLKATGEYISGQVHETAVWVYDARTDEFDLASALAGPELRIFSEGPLEGNLITADWDWAKGESRWDDHRRAITVYRFGTNNGAGTYREVFKYTTGARYGAEDTSTIDSETGAILARRDGGNPVQVSQDMDEMLHANGARATIAGYFLPPGVGNAAVESGNAVAIDVAFKLLPHSDAGAHEGLKSSIAAALATNPEAVLRHLKELPADQRPRYCVPFLPLEYPREKNSAVVARSVAGLQRVTRADLQPLKKMCLGELHEVQQSVQPAPAP